MSGWIHSTAVLLGRTVLSPIAPHSMVAVNVEYAKQQGNNDDDLTASSGPSLHSLISACPSLDPTQSPTYKPTPWLSTGHLQTIYCAMANFSHIDPVEYQRRVFLTPDGGTIAVDISPPSLAPSEDELKLNNEAIGSDGVPTVVCLHGLTGGSHESYVRNCFTYLTKPKDQGGLYGYRGVVVNFRGCANVPLTSPQLYSASKTADVRCALLFLTKLYPNSPMVGLGFSLGANVLAKYLGEQGDDTPLLGGIVVGTPFDLKSASDALEYGGFLPQEYSSAMCSNLERMAKRHKDTLALYPPLRNVLDHLYDPPALSKDEYEKYKDQVKRKGPDMSIGEKRIVKPKTLNFADEAMTKLLGGHCKPYGEFPFETADDYYRHGSCVNVLDQVQRPLLCLSAQDDPIIPSHVWKKVRASFGYDETGQPKSQSNGDGDDQVNGNIALAWTQTGGHLGWFEGIRPKRWLYHPLTEFIHAIFQQSSQQFKEKTKSKQLWNQVDQVLIKKVDIELIPTNALPVYHLPGETPTPNPNTNTNTNTESNSRMAWLLTKLLDQAPLVHPSQSHCGSYLSGTEEKGWETLKQQQMFIDVNRPEVGFCQLSKDTRVAGVGQVFKGGIESLGYDQDHGQQFEKVIAGL